MHTTGFETDIQYTHQLNSKQNLTAGVGLVWLDSKSSDSVTSFYVSSHAKFLTNFSIIYQCHNFSFSVNGLYKKRKQQAASSINAVITPDYFVMNAKAEYGFLRKTLSVFVQSDNIFDRKYSDLLGSVMPGRWITGGVKYQFSK